MFESSLNTYDFWWIEYTENSKVTVIASNLIFVHIHKQFCSVPNEFCGLQRISDKNWYRTLLWHAPKKTQAESRKKVFNNIIVLMWIITIKCVECNVRRFSLVGNMLYLTEPKMNMYEWKLQHVIIMLLLYSHHPIIIARINVVKVLLSAQVYLEQIAFECIKTSKKIWEKNKKFYEKFYCVLKE